MAEIVNLRHTRSILEVQAILLRRTIFANEIMELVVVAILFVGCS